MSFLKQFIRKTSTQALKPLTSVGIIHLPFKKSQDKSYVIPNRDLMQALNEIEGLTVKDFGEIEPPVENLATGTEGGLTALSTPNIELSKRVSQVLKEDRVVVTLGRDHNVGIGSIDGHFRVNEEMILICVDAHADLVTNVALFAKELAYFTRSILPKDWPDHKFSIKKLGYIGLRSINHDERPIIESRGVPCFAMEDIDKHGINTAVRQLLDRLNHTNTKPIHVKFSIDALDALVAPSTKTPMRAGLTLREAIGIMEMLHATGCLRVVDLVEINPALGDEADRQHTQDAALCILKAALGFSRRGSLRRAV